MSKKMPKKENESKVIDLPVGDTTGQPSKEESQKLTTPTVNQPRGMVYLQYLTKRYDGEVPVEEYRNLTNILRMESQAMELLNKVDEFLSIQMKEGVPPTK